MTGNETALIVLVPAAEAAVGEHRAALDRAAAWGVPAHVTVLYPFLPPERVDDEVRAGLAALFAAYPRFDVTLREVAWFGDRVVYLAPRPEEPFRQLTNAVWSLFPEVPPYGGRFDDVVPHLTVGEGGPLPRLRAAADAVGPQLPVTATARSVHLFEGATGRVPWRPVAEFPLAAPHGRGDGPGGSADGPGGSGDVAGRA